MRLLFTLTLSRTPRRPSARALLVVLVLALLAPVANLAHGAIPGNPCWEPNASDSGPITASGSTTQLSVHLNLFIPRYEQRCPQVVGLVNYQGLGDAYAARAIVRHSRGSDLTKPSTLYPSDLPLSLVEKEMAEFDTTNAFTPRTGSLVQHHPVLLNGFSIGYNLGGCSATAPLKISGRNLSLIYTGVIRRWNDPALVIDNPTLAPCTTPIKVSVRADEHASSTVLRDYLAQTDPVTWTAYRHKDLNTVWPPVTPIACSGALNLGMTQCLERSGAIGYVEYKEAFGKTAYRSAALENASGEFVAPAADMGRTEWPDGCVAAAQSSFAPGSSTSHEWSNYTLTNVNAGYPLCAYSYIMNFQRLLYAYAETLSPAQIRTTVDYLNTLAQDAVLDAVTAQGYAPVPPSPHPLRATIRRGIAAISY